MGKKKDKKGEHLLKTSLSPAEYVSAHIFSSLFSSSEAGDLDDIPLRRVCAEDDEDDRIRHVLDARA